MSENTEIALVGRCFHIFDGDGRVQYQGVVRSELGGGNYLVQYFDWLIGDPSTLAVVPVAKMIEPELHRGAGAWQFYEDADHMRFWLEHHGQRA